MKKFDIPDDYYEMRHSKNYWMRQKEMEENDLKNYSVMYRTKSKAQEGPKLTPLREETSEDVQRVVKTKNVT